MDLNPRPWDHIGRHEEIDENVNSSRNVQPILLIFELDFTNNVLTLYYKFYVNPKIRWTVIVRTDGRTDGRTDRQNQHMHKQLINRC